MKRILRIGRTLLPWFLGFAGNAVATDTAPVSERVVIPVASAETRAQVRMVTGVFRPGGDGPFPVVVYSHGRSGTEVDRALTQVPDIRGHVRYWLAKGFAVVAPIRPGYGETGGADREDSGVRYDIFGNCWGETNFTRSADAASTAVLATLRWLHRQPWANADRVVLVGASMGGLASVASAAHDPPGVVAYVNFSGGTGGNGRRAAEHSCGLDRMENVMAHYGRTTNVASLWLYAKNDSFWGAYWPRAWFDAFARGGSRAHFVMTDAVPNADGHQLLTRGRPMWGPAVDAFLAELGF